MKMLCICQDAGYGERSLFAPEDDDDENMQMKIDDEVGCTKAIYTMKES